MPATSSDAQGWCKLKQHPSSIISISSRSCTRLWRAMLPASLNEAGCKVLPIVSWNWGKWKIARGPTFWVPVKIYFVSLKPISEGFILILSSQYNNISSGPFTSSLEFCIYFLLASYIDSPLQLYYVCTPAILAIAADYGIHYIIYYLVCSSKCILRGCIYF